MSAQTRSQRLVELARAFLWLGCVSFGGPIAHLGYFRSELVERRRWLDEAEFSELVALCQFLPGPASSQTVFAIGLRRGGLAGALVAAACFTAPSALLMLLFASGLTALGLDPRSGWVRGLELATVAVVAQAVWSMGRALCPDLPRRSLAVLAALALTWRPGAVTQLAVLALGAFAGWASRRGAPPAQAEAPARRSVPRGAVAALAAFGSLLVVLPLLASTVGVRWLDEGWAFFRAGALVFGGGHVVLPLLREALVPPGWLGDDAFLAGYAAAQALPGPLFAFAAYLGASMHPGPLSWAWGAWALFALYLPAYLLVGGALPFWAALRRQPWAHAALSGANAAVVGVLLAALIRPIAIEAIHGPVGAALVVLAYLALQRWKLPPWLVVAALALLGWAQAVVVERVPALSRVHGPRAPDSWSAPAPREPATTREQPQALAATERVPRHETTWQRSPA